MAGFPTVYDDQAELLVAVAALHNGGKPFSVDLTYGSGSFWTGEAERLKPSIRMDVEPVWKRSKNDPKTEYTEVNLQADARHLPFRDGSLESVIIDFPFLHAAGKDSIMGKRFSSYPSQKELRKLYWHTGMQLQRALQPGGLVVQKCQDIVESGKQVWTHIHIADDFRTMGFEMIDLLILVRKATIPGWNHSRQAHARKNHSFFLVFRQRTK